MKLNIEIEFEDFEVPTKVNVKKGEVTHHDGDSLGVRFNETIKISSLDVESARKLCANFTESVMAQLVRVG